MLIDVAENQIKARGKFESVTMVTTVGSSEESCVEDRKLLGLREVAWCSREHVLGFGTNGPGFY